MLLRFCAEPERKPEMTMNIVPAKTETAKPAGRRYASVSKLFVKEKVSSEIRAEVLALNAHAVVVRQLLSFRASAGMTQTDLAQKNDEFESLISKGFLAGLLSTSWASFPSARTRC
jgi:hypothetical protein